MSSSTSAASHGAETTLVGLDNLPELDAPSLGDGGGTGGAPVREHRRWRPYPASVVALAVGLLATAALSWASFANHNDNEQRLLRLQVRQVAAAVGAALPSVQTPLLAASDVASATGDNVAQVRSFLQADVGTAKPFVSVSLWRLQPGGSPQLLTTVGDSPALARRPHRLHAYFSRLHPSPTLSVIGILRGPDQRLGYSEYPPGDASRLVVYAESALPWDKKLAIPKSSAFSDLRYALYLGHRQKPVALLGASAALPISGRSAHASVPFGDTSITLVATPIGELGGDLSQRLPWIILAAGVVASVGGALVTQWLVRRRRDAERLASDNARLYSQQRGIAETLQRALLPTELPQVRGLEMDVRYVPGVDTMEVGGDWYDVIQIDEQRCFFVVGDVSGRGLGAATTMASLRFATRGFVAEGHGPASVVHRLRDLLNVGTGGQFATMVCGIADAARHRISLVNAGHPTPLLVGSDGSCFVESPLSPPVGVPFAGVEGSVEVAVQPGATLLLFTDGLVERRREDPHQSKERLRQAVASRETNGNGHGPGTPETLDRLMGQVLATMAPGGKEDDIAMLGFRWTQ